MQLGTASMNDVFDEYARELCGEYNRWAILKRHKAFETRLQTYNRTALRILMRLNTITVQFHLTS
jgi:hypothetical protein